MRKAEWYMLNEALAEERQGSSRRIVVSIPERKLILIEAGRVLKTYAVAVGAAASPTPAGARQPLGSALDRPEPEELRHSRNQMRNGDVQELFDLVEVGDTVELLAEPLPDAQAY